MAREKLSKPKRGAMPARKTVGVSVEKKGEVKFHIPKPLGAQVGLVKGAVVDFDLDATSSPPQIWIYLADDGLGATVSDKGAGNCFAIRMGKDAAHKVPLPCPLVCTDVAACRIITVRGVKQLEIDLPRAALTARRAA